MILNQLMIYFYQKEVNYNYLTIIIISFYYYIVERD